MNPGPQYHRFTSPGGEHVLVVEDSSIYDVPSGADELTLAGMLGEVAGPSPYARPSIEDVASGSFSAKPQSISLNVSSGCNLSCSYCYASGGDFEGKQSSYMTAETARDAVDRLLGWSDPSRPITVGFMGGEPEGSPHFFGF